MICGPRIPLRTENTRHLIRVPCSYFSPGTRSATGSSASSLPRSTMTSSGLRPCWMTPEMMSPSLPENSPYRMSSSASRSRCSMICFAVVAAIRPNPSGVSSNSPTLFALVVELGGQHRHVAGLAVEDDAGLLGRAGRLLVRREEGLLDGLHEDVEGDLLLALEAAQDAEVDVHGGQSSPSSGLVLAVELDLDQRLGDVGVGTSRRVPSTSSGRGVVVGADDPAGDGLAVGGGHLDQPVGVATPVPGQRQRSVDAAGGDLERVRAARPSRRWRRAPRRPSGWRRRRRRG